MNYELTVLISGKANAAKQKSFLEKVKKVIETFKGKIAKTDEWGKLDLAYDIQKDSTGVFLHFKLELDGASAKKLGDKLRAEAEVLRFLILRKD